MKNEELQKRVEQFNCLEKPGWHMSTVYLVSDLVKEIHRLENLVEGRDENGKLIPSKPFSQRE